MSPLGQRALLAIALVPVPAGATPTKDQCVDANADGQALRLEGKFAEARHKFESCMDASCPSIVRDDCVGRLKDLDVVQPTIVFEVRDTGGASVGTAQASVDGRPAGRLDGTATRVDPGEHTFTFTADDSAPVVRRLTIKEGERDRHERIVLSPVVALSLLPPVAAAPAALTPAPRPGMATQKLLGLAMGGVGLAGIAVGGVFGVLTFSAVSDQKTVCASANNCTSRANALSDHATAQTDGLVSTVAFVAGGTMLAAGVLVFLTAPGVSQERAGSPSAGAGHRGWSIQPMAGPDGAGLSMRWEL